MSSIANKVKDAVGLGSHDSQHQSSGLTGSNSARTNENTSLHNNSTTTGVEDTLSPNDAAQNSRPSGRKMSDAAQMPPSVFRQHAGEPSIEHDYPHDASSKRHSVSHQENHYMR